MLIHLFLAILVIASVQAEEPVLPAEAKPLPPDVAYKPDRRREANARPGSAGSASVNHMFAPHFGIDESGKGDFSAC